MTRSPLGISRNPSWRPGSHDAMMPRRTRTRTRAVMKMTANGKALGQTFDYHPEWDAPARAHA